MHKPKVTVINEDGTLLAHNCTIQQLFSKEPNGEITHVGIHWYNNIWSGEDTGDVHIVPIDRVLYERGCPDPIFSLSDREPDIVVTRIAISEQLRNEIYERDGYRCVKCNTDQDLSIDHIIPFSKGGKTERNNLQTLCMTCNRKKRALLE